MKVFISAMPGYGNFGDDLISLYLINNVIEKYGKDVQIGINCGPYPNLCSNLISSNLEYFPEQSYKNIFKKISANRKLKSFLVKCDTLFIGGGGLFQDSHYLFTIHNFVRYIKYTDADIALVGLGIGPIKNKLNKFYLKFIFENIDMTVQLRDNDSRNEIKKSMLKSKIEVNCDIVEGSSLDRFLDNNNISKYKRKGVLGCSVRKWNDFTLNFIIDYIFSIAIKHKIKEINFFNFEYSIDNLEEYEFSLSIKNGLNKLMDKNQITDIKMNIYSYTKDEMFLQKFLTVEFGIASRYHANILWQKNNTPVIPLPYASKVISLYKNRGIKIKKTNDLSINDDFISINIDSIYKLPVILNFKKKNKYKSILFFFVFDCIEVIYLSTRFILNTLNFKCK
jgi:polysaccharide pyruvyl transferase WcaK-like protein